MSTEEFEKKLRSHDPAAHLAGRESHEERALFERAINGTPANVVSISRWTNRRKAVSAAAAALLVVGFGGPIISGTASAGPDRLVFGEAQSNLSADKMAGGLTTRESMTSDYYFGGWGFYTYELADNVVNNLPTSAVAYKIVNLSNINQRIQEIADVFGVENLMTSSYDKDALTSEQENFYAWTQDGSGSFSYYNSEVDPWRDCYSSVSSSEDGDKEEICEPITTNLYTQSEAEDAAVNLLAAFGFERSSLRFESYETDYSTEVYAIEQVNGFDSPISFYFSFVSNGDLYSAGGSLTKLVEVANYDLVNLEAAVTRANDLTMRTIDSWNSTTDYVGEDSEPGSSGSTKSNDGEVSDPVEPSVEVTEPSEEPTANTEEPIGPQPEYAPSLVKVSKVAIGYQVFWMGDQSSYWLPVVNFLGTTNDSEEVVTLGSIVAIVDSQIDLESLYMSMGMLNGYSRNAMLD
jgi:hypothetical protein